MGHRLNERDQQKGDYKGAGRHEVMGKERRRGEEEGGEEVSGVMQAAVPPKKDDEKQRYMRCGSGTPKKR